MKQIASFKKFPLLLIASGLLISVAFSQSNSATQKQSATDTIPAKQKKVQNLDEVLEELDRSEIEIQKSLKSLDGEKLAADMRNAMKSMDIDMAKMKEDMAKAMKDIDMQKINLEVQAALKEINTAKLQSDVAKALAQVDMEKVAAELQKVKDIDLKEIQKELATIQPQVEKAMKEAKVDIEKAKTEIASYKGLVNELDKNGLLKKDGEYKIEYKAKALTVNGKTLSAAETEKYSDYLRDKKDFTLNKSENGLNINN